MKNGKIKDGDKITWYKNDLIHRDKGHAVEYLEWNPLSGDKDVLVKEWYVHGVRHRVGGPAIQAWVNEYWINGQRLTKEDHDHYVDKLNLNKKLEKNLINKLKVKPKKI